MRVSSLFQVAKSFRTEKLKVQKQLFYDLGFKGCFFIVDWSIGIDSNTPSHNKEGTERFAMDQPET